VPIHAPAFSEGQESDADQPSVLLAAERHCRPNTSGCVPGSR
jgi:hypothetical protein